MVSSYVNSLSVLLAANGATVNHIVDLANHFQLSVRVLCIISQLRDFVVWVQFRKILVKLQSVPSIHFGEIEEA